MYEYYSLDCISHFYSYWLGSEFLFSFLMQLLQNIMRSTELYFPSDITDLSSDCIDLCRKLLRRNPGILRMYLDIGKVKETETVTTHYKIQKHNFLLEHEEVLFFWTCNAWSQILHMVLVTFSPESVPKYVFCMFICLLSNIQVHGMVCKPSKKCMRFPNIRKKD